MGLKRTLIVGMLCAPIFMAILLPVFFKGSSFGFVEMFTSSFILFLNAMGVYLVSALVVRDIFHKN